MIDLTVTTSVKEFVTTDLILRIMRSFYEHMDDHFDFLDVSLKA